MFLRMDFFDVGEGGMVFNNGRNVGLNVFFSF